jgi:hypothetical protein
MCLQPYDSSSKQASDGTCSHDHSSTEQPPAGPGRRSFLRTAGLAGVGAAALGGLTAGPAAAAVISPSAARNADAGWNPDQDSSRFTLAVMPDTQFLYWGTQGSVNPEPQEESFRYVIANSGSRSERNIVFMAHLGDLTEDAAASSFGYVGHTFDIMDAHGAAYSVLAGNHDVNASTDDTRGPTPYLDTMGPQRFKSSKTFAGSDSTGYNTAHVFTAGGQEWLLLAMDWRTASGGWAWANQFLKANPKLPVILTTHEIAGPTYDDTVYPYLSGNAENDAELSAYGQTVWNELINENNQIFLTINGHYWPPGRTTLKNAAGNDVHVHITNYQNRYFGGGAMLRLYHFDMVQNTIVVETLSPWALTQNQNVLAAQEARLTTTVDRFSVPIDFESRFSSFITPVVLPPLPAKAELLPGTLAYWRFDAGGANGTPFTSGQVVKDLSGHGNDLSVLNVVPGSAADALTWSNQFHPDQPGHGSLYFQGGQNPLNGAYLTTPTNAPLNTETFPSGFTIEAFVQLSLDWNENNNSWMAVLSRWGESGQAGKYGGNTDPQEPIFTLSFSDGREPQCVFYPLNQHDSTTLWGEGLPENTWWHVALVNDGSRTTMYVEGCPTVDIANQVSSNGITQLALPWALGGYEYGGSINQIYNGWVGDVRIVNRALPVSQFMLNR